MGSGHPHFNPCAEKAMLVSAVGVLQKYCINYCICSLPLEHTMKQADLIALEQTLASLPVDLKKYLADQLLGQISSQADTLLETVRPHLPCPHCGSEHPAKWGRSGGLQRYRCRNPDCHKTFNALTGTPLAKLQHRDKWFDYLRCMRDSLTLRVSAARVGIDLKTAFHW